MRWRIRAAEAAATPDVPKPVAIKPKAAEKKEPAEEAYLAVCRRHRRIRGRFARASCDVRESQRRADRDRRAAAAS